MKWNCKKKKIVGHRTFPIKVGTSHNELIHWQLTVPYMHTGQTNFICGIAHTTNSQSLVSAVRQHTSCDTMKDSVHIQLMATPLSHGYNINTVINLTLHYPTPRHGGV